MIFTIGCKVYSLFTLCTHTNIIGSQIVNHQANFSTVSICHMDEDI